MSKSEFSAALDAILDFNLLPHVDFQNFKNEETLDISLRQTLSNVEFVRFLLSFLRESASTVLSSQNHNTSSGKCHDESNTNEKCPSPCDVTTRFEKSLKFQDNVGRQRTKFQSPGASARKTYTKPQEYNRIMPKAVQNRPFSKQNKREPIHLNDFLTADSSMASLSQKKRYPRKGKRVNLSHVSESRPKPSRDDDICQLNSGTPTSLNVHQNMNRSHSPDRNSNKIFEVDDFPALSNAATTSKPSRRIKPTLVKVNGLTPGHGAIYSSETSVKRRADLQYGHTVSVSANPFIASAESISPAKFKNERDMLMKMKIEFPSSNSGTVKVNIMIIKTQPAVMHRMEIGPLYIFMSFFSATFSPTHKA